MTDSLQTRIDRAVDLAADEVVTRALSRDVDLPHGAGTAVLITLDNGADHTRPNTFGPASLRELNTALDTALNRDDICAIAVTGKPFILAAGADLSGVATIADIAPATEIARIGHEVFRKFADAAVPSFAFINGLALGGGLEVALHCDYRTVSTAATGLAFPECYLGLVPGWGGTYLLPNLIGADRAVTVIIENALNRNQMLSPRQADQLGIADIALDAADYLERSLEWASGVITGAVPVEREDIDRGEAWDAAIARGTEIADAQMSGAAPAPYRALDLIAAAKDGDRDAAFERENTALGELIMSEELRSGLYAFDLVQKRARKPADAPDKALARPIAKVGIVGAGLMACQLATLFLRRMSVPVVITDVDAERVDRGIATVHSEIDRLLGKGRITDDVANRFRSLITGTTEDAGFADCDLVIEAVSEDLAIKRDVFARLERHVSSECVLATNTSALSVSAMAEGCAHPERVVGFHFFNPVAVLPLVEVVRGDRSDDAAVATALSAAKQLKKNAVIAADAPGFVVNRLLTRLMGEVIAAVDEGTPVTVADSAFRPLGLPMSAMTLLQLVGPAVALHVAETLHDRFPDRFAVSPNLQALVDSGRPGVYDWAADGQPYVPDELLQQFTTGDRPSSRDQVRDRALAALASEIEIMLSERVVAAPMDIDLCLILGAGWPFHLGGITPYLDRSGVAEQIAGHRFLPRGVASVPAG